MGWVMRVADLPGGQVIKRNRRSTDSGLRRKAMHVSRVRGARTPVERVNAARDYLLAQLAHVDDTAAEQASTRIAQVLCATADALERDRINGRKAMA